LLVLFEEEDQFAHQVAFAESVKAVPKAQIAGEEVMHQPAREFGDDAQGLDGRFASAQMDSEKRQQGRANAMQPMFDLIDRHAGFVGVEDRFLGQAFHQSVFKGLQGLVLLLPSALQGGFTDRITEHLLAHFTNAQAGALLGVVEVSQESAEVLPLLDWSFERDRKGSRAGSLAAGALFGFSPVLGAFQFQGRQIEDLAALKVNGGLLGEIFAALTLQQGMDLEVVRSVAAFESAAGMPGLAARFTAGLFAQALGLGLLRSIGGGGRRTVAAVLRGGVAEPPHLGLELEGVIGQSA
jgi:hypothetical protein